MSLRGQEILSVCREVLQDVRECSGCPAGHPGEVGRPSWKIGSGLEALLDVREALQDVREWSGDRPVCLGGLPGSLRVVESPPGCLGVDERPSQMSVSGRETLPVVRK